MSSTYFDVVEHISPSQYIRQHPWGAKSDDAKLRLAVKEYRTRDSTTNDDEDAVTIIASHGNGFPKETYEPLFDDLVNNVSGFKIRAIWIADVANQAASYALNEDQLGDDPNWFDHSRDLLLMVNHFREQMKPPFFGLAHSMGCAHM
jgi:alpha-beta hydrolase superfamily lysophospholipase